ECDCLNFDMDSICSHIFALIYFVTNNRVNFQVPGSRSIVLNLDDFGAEQFYGFEKELPKTKSLPLWREFIEDFQNGDALEDLEIQKPAKVYEWWYALVPVGWK